MSQDGGVIEEDDATGGEITAMAINVSTFDELQLDASVLSAAQGAWYMYLSAAASREAAGEAMYTAIMEAAPSLTHLFTSPKAVQAMRFMSALSSFVSALDEPPKLKILVESVGFGHMHLEVTVPRVVIIRDALLDLFSMELGAKMVPTAQSGWKTLLNYIGGAIIFCRAHYAERINTLLSSWKKANKKPDELAEEGAEGGGGESNVKDEGKDQAEEEGKTRVRNNQLQSIPQTFPEMYKFNAAVMGMGDRLWMNEVLACFDNMVINVANPARLQDEADLASIRIAKLKEAGTNLGEFKSCMLASLRSLLPGSWSTNHEVAWSWFWEQVERLVKSSPFFVKGTILERAVARLLDGLEEDQKYSLRSDLYTRFFTNAPGGQDYFKQSHTYLHIIADKVLDMTLEFYREPVKVVDDVSAIGLRHVGYGIQTEFLPSYVSACVDTLVAMECEEAAVESVRCSLGLLSKMMVRTINEGSTIVMKAINANSIKQTRKSIACAPRCDRAAWMLMVQVGTQSISPLAWAIQSGAQEAARAMLQDLFTIRADRDRYYYAMDDVFVRHPDLVKLLLDEAPALVPKLFDGLVWRSRIAEGGLRRVNYYVKHLVIDGEGESSQAMDWIAATKDPKLVCHPVMVLLNDLVWGHVVYSIFLRGKIWLFFTILVFIASQNKSLEQESLVAVFACKTFVYSCVLGLLIYRHTKCTILSVQAGDVMKVACMLVPGYLREWQESCSLAVLISLFAMFALEPIMQCWSKSDELFDGNCSSGAVVRQLYSLSAMCAMFAYWILLTDLSVFSNRVASYVLICVQVASELGLFLFALGVTILTFASAVSCLVQDGGDFQNIFGGATALFEISLRVFSNDRYEAITHMPMVLLSVFVFIIVTTIFFNNLLVAQLYSVYSSSFDDMVGYARLGRLQVIVDTLPKVSPKNWANFVDVMQFDKKIEFNEGDIGVAGGLQIREAASLHPTLTDMVRRFGGSTSPQMQWPEETDNSTDEDDKFERIEKLLQNIQKRLAGGPANNGGGGGRSGSMGAGGGGGTSGDLAGGGSSEEMHAEMEDGGGDNTL
eukprot:TRINITY_DN3963_c0_g1_i9.p1 TRINITY_DN3963_c0_g1~~TRINITY_DN3963_c0_g1_i9.p1  ORF type:complete len:1061 (-),score=226.45 TRINITY_DN3963_c0_g1_i9:506-3688(-)